jgi:hypothetical protein
MAKGFVEQNMHWFTTPEELRAIALVMEKQYKNAIPGDRNVTKVIELDAEHAIYIHYDQENMI